MALISSLPGRLRRRFRAETTIREQLEALPRSYIDAIGPGEFVAVGDSIVEMLRRYAGLRMTDAVLDIGCGLGRVAIPLQKILTLGSYDGFDVVAEYVDWDQAQITSRSPDFTFRLLDIHSSMYNPASANAPATVTFPYADAQFTLAIATSLFSHLLPDATRRYFSEAARVLKRGGRAVFTFFLLDDVALAKARTLETYPTFAHAFELGLLNDPARPAEAVAYYPDWILGALRETGLEPDLPVRWGKWSGRENPLSYQDVVVAKKR